MFGWVPGWVLLRTQPGRAGSGHLAPGGGWDKWGGLTSVVKGLGKGLYKNIPGTLTGCLVLEKVKKAESIWGREI